MATGLHEANDFPDADYSVPHRSPPPIPLPTPPYHIRSDSRPGRRHQRDTSGESSQGEGRRRGSFSFLRRSSSASRSTGPATRIAQAHREAAIAAAEGRQGEDVDSYNNNTNTLTPGIGSKMLRKQSKAKAAQQEQERQAKAQELAARPAPRLPSQNPLPSMAGFGGEEARPDSVAMFSGHAQPSHPPQPYGYQQPNPSNNFSRPTAAMPSATSSKYSSNMYSSPATGSSSYGARSSPMPGNAFAQQSSSMSSVTSGLPNGVGYVHESGSMRDRGRYGNASRPNNVNNVNSPRRVRRRKDPTPFNILVLGAKNSGKTSFISFLQHTLSLPVHKQTSHPEMKQEGVGKGKSTSFTPTYTETEMDGERVGLTLWDSAGLEKNVVDLQLREVTAFIEAKFEDTFTEEQKVNRSPGAKDTHIHCVFLVLDPVRLDSTVATDSSRLANIGCLDDDFDLQVMRALEGKTTVIPVVSKADTLTTGHMSFLKRAVWQSLSENKINPLEALDLELDSDEGSDEESGASDSSEADDRAVHSPSGRPDDSIIDNLVDRSSSDSEATSSSSPPPPDPNPKRPTHARQASRISNGAGPTAEDEDPFLPLSILSPDPYDLPPYSKPTKSQVLGRRFPWGLADPLNPDHCDFTRLRESIFSEWRSELREASREKWYEQWRTSRLKNLPGQGRQRVKGGITPSAIIPREGRGSPSASRTLSQEGLGGGLSVARTFSGDGLGAGSLGGGGSSVARSGSVATSAGFSQVGMAVTTPGDVRDSTRIVGMGSGKAERVMGVR